jgi:hypothetical protein
MSLPDRMHAMVLRKPGRPLDFVGRFRPLPGPSEILLCVSACGVGRTDLHLVDGDLPDSKLLAVPGHGIVGTGAGQAADQRPPQRMEPYLEVGGRQNHPASSGSGSVVSASRSRSRRSFTGRRPAYSMTVPSSSSQ